MIRVHLALWLIASLFSWQGAAAAEEDLRSAFEAGVEAYQAERYEEAFEIWSRLAERGLPGAQSNVGLLYSEGLGVEKNLEQAVTWFRHAARSDHAPGQYNLGLAYLTGSGIEEDDDRGLYWMRRAALQDYKPAQERLARMFAEGLGVPEDAEKAAMWQERAATTIGPDLGAVTPPTPSRPAAIPPTPNRNAASKPAPTPVAPQTAPTFPTGRVQFAAFQSRDQAEKARQSLARELADPLAGVGLELSVYRPSAEVTYYRVVTAALPEAEARALREKMIARGVDCLLR